MTAQIFWNAHDGFQDTGVAAITSRHNQRLREARDAVIHDPAIVTAGFMTERTGNPILTHASGSVILHGFGGLWRRLRRLQYPSH
jgi:hypothetical protein